MQTPACRFIIIHGIRIKSHTPADFIIFLFIIKRKYSKYSSLSLDPFWVTWLAIVFPPLYPIQTKSSNPHGSWNESMSDDKIPSQILIYSAIAPVTYRKKSTRSDPPPQIGWHCGTGLNYCTGITPRHSPKPEVPRQAPPAPQKHSTNVI